MLKPTVQFLPLHPDHLALLHGWLQKPHVREFWDDGDRTQEQVWATYFIDLDVEPFLVLLDGSPIGYVQAYPVTPQDDFGAFCKGITWGMDLFIGEESELGKGRGTLAVKTFVQVLQQRHGARRILIDPATHNARAIHVYQNAGFVLLDEVELERQRFLVMALDL